MIDTAIKNVPDFELHSTGPHAHNQETFVKNFRFIQETLVRVDGVELTIAKEPGPYPDKRRDYPSKRNDYPDKRRDYPDKKRDYPGSPHR